jgi:hypothetical protein
MRAGRESVQTSSRCQRDKMARLGPSCCFVARGGVMSLARLVCIILAAGAAACSAEAPPPQLANPATSPPSKASQSWLDRQLENWNTAGRDLAKAPPAEEPSADVVERCRLTPPQSTAGERAVAAAGWIPFLPGGKPLSQNEVEIIGGMAGADGMCRPVDYNLFVFVAGKFAGTLSPAVMTSRLDGSSGMVELMSDSIDAEYSRYTETDPLCCPSSRVRVRYRIERSPDPVVVPTTVTPVPAE